MKKDNAQIHAMLLALVGGYILYTAYHLFENLQSGVDDMSPAAAITAIVLFALAGVGVLIYAWRVYRTAPKNAEEQNDQDDRSLK